MELIISHTNCDFDGFASMLAASLLYPEAKICLAGSPDSNLKVFLKKYEDNLSYLTERAIEPENVTKLIVVDNRDITRMGKMGNYLRKGKKGIKIFCYDHHPSSPNDIDADYSHIEMTGACATILIEILIKEGIIIPPFLASVLALGIYQDTGSFLNVNTSAKDLNAVSYLLTQGASLKFVKENLRKDFTSQQINLINDMINHCEKIPIKGIILHLIELEDDSDEDIAFLLQTVKASLAAKLLFCLCKKQEKIQIIARNDYDFIKLDKIMQEMGGGGHRSAGYAVVKSNSDELIDSTDVKNTIVSLLERDLIRYGLASELMSYPVDSVTSKCTVNEARAKLLSKNYSTIVIAENDIIKGIVTKKDISRALHHNMENHLLEDMMSTKIITAKEDDSIFIVYKLMIDHNIGRIPIVDNKGHLKGIITRSDLLTYHFQYMEKEKQLTGEFDSVKGLMQRNLDAETIDTLKKAGHIGDILNYRVFVVGGLVRDLLMSRRNYDIDLVVEGDGIKFAETFAAHFGKKISAFSKFGTAIVVLKNRNRIDIATARTEYYAKSGSLPEVSFSGIKNDLYRRDFTINSLAIQLNPKEFGKLLDCFNGRKDINLGTIRVVNNFSFIEDPIRILRAIRFEQRFGFTLEEKTKHLLKKSLSLKSFSNVTCERIRSEMIVSCMKGEVDKFFLRLEELGILQHISEQIIYNTEKNALCCKLNELYIWFRNTFPDEVTENWLSYHLVLIYDLSLRMKEKFVKAYKYPNTFKEAVLESDYFIKHFQIDEYDIDKLYLFLLQQKIETLLFILALSDDNQERKIIVTEYILENRFVKTEINGSDLIALGLEQGKDIGEVLKLILLKRIRKELTNREQEISFAKEQIAGIKGKQVK